MISNLSPEEKQEWDRQMQQHLDRATGPRFTERTVVLIIILVVMLFGGVGICATLTWQPQLGNSTPVWDGTIKSPSKILDSTEPETGSILAYTDSLLRTDSVLHPHPGQWTMDSIIAYINKMGHCRLLEDSEENLKLLVAQGRASQRAYNRAYKVYSDYYRNVYEPAWRRLKAHTGRDSL